MMGWITRGMLLSAGLLCLISLGRADDAGAWRSKPAAELASHQSHGGVTIAAEPYEQEDKVEVAFGGAYLATYGFLPVLLVITNDRPRISQRGPLDVWQVTAREFKAPFVAPKASASGFFYFWVGEGDDVIPGSTAYVTGLVDSRSERDLMYFEIDLEPYNLERRKEKIDRARSPSRVRSQFIGYR